jgi:hypothetical protein
MATAPPVQSELVDAGLRRALLAGWARELGLRASAAQIAAARGAIGGEARQLVRRRLAEEVALERLVLDHAPRMLNDGPSAVEAGLAEQRLGGRPRR